MDGYLLAEIRNHGYDHHFPDDLMEGGCTREKPPSGVQDCYEACYRFGLVSCHYGLLGGGFLDFTKRAFHFGKPVGEREDSF